MMNKLSFLQRYITQLAMIATLSACSAVKTPTDQLEKTADIPTKTIDKPPARPAVLNETDLDLYHQAKGHIVINDFASAEEILRQLHIKYQNHYGVLLNLAISKFKLKDMDNAQEYLQRAMDIDQANKTSEAHNLQGLMYTEQGKIELAKESYEAALQLDPNSFNAHFNLGLLYDVYYQQLTTAYAHYEQYLNLNPNDDQSTKNWLRELKYSIDAE